MNYIFIKKYLQFMRFPNLLIIDLTQFLTYRYLSELNPTNSAFSYAFLFTLITTSMFSAAAGNIINDIFDHDIDTINKPHKLLIINEIGEKKAWRLYYILLVISFLSALLFDYFLGAFWLLFYQIFINISLFLYSKYLKKLPLLGNLLVSSLCALVVIIVIFAFDVISNQQSVDNQFIWCYVGFAFLSTLFREIIKDIEDIEGDKALNCKTLPILFGIKTSKTIAIFSMLLLIGIVMAISKNQWLGILVTIFAFAIIFQTFRAQQKSQFHSISQVTKGLMLLGLAYLIL